MRKNLLTLESASGAKDSDSKDSAKKARNAAAGKEIPKEALKTMIASSGFNEFLDKSSKIIERVLQNPESDVVMDYFSSAAEPRDKKYRVEGYFRK